MVAKKIGRPRYRCDLTAEELRERLDYNPDTGEFTTRPRKISRVLRFGKTRMPAAVIDLKGKDGVWRHYYAHRLAWLWKTGEWPNAEIDHINGDSTDNRWSNLREATHTQNNRNKDFAKRKKSGLVGANFHKASRLWRATLRRETIGYYKTEEEAHEAYERAARAAYGKFAHSSLTSEAGASYNSSDKIAVEGLELLLRSAR
jgi:hypothetical protein